MNTNNLKGQDLINSIREFDASITSEMVQELWDTVSDSTRQYYTDVVEPMAQRVWGRTHTLVEKYHSLKALDGEYYGLRD